MNDKLSSEICVPCSIDTPPMSGEILYKLLNDLHDKWILIDELSLERVFKFKDFKSALDFVNRVGELAQSEGHHPDIELAWGRVKVKLITHKIKGLSRNDFILAAKIDKIVD